jgi:hypothetical protein
MKLSIHSPAKALSKAYLRQSLKREQIEQFKFNLALMFERIRTDEHEEHLKNIVSDFLKDTWYKQSNEINTSGRTDLVIHNGKSSSDTVGVLIEVKRPDNSSEMISHEKPNAKALHELLHYYMQERYVKGNMEVRRLIVCNIHEWYIFDASDFERLFFHNRKFVENYQKWSTGLFSGDKTEWLYREILRPFVENELETLPCTYFNLKEYGRSVRRHDGEDDRKLIALYKLLSPPHLLKQSFANDANSLNREFYSELLHILGLEETKEKGKKLITRKAPERRNDASLLENAINILKVRNKLPALDNPEQLAASEDEQYFSLGLELCIIWLNRILFLKLLEGQLRTYHRNSHEYAFLNMRRIADFDELEELFFEVLARRKNDRAATVQAKFGDIPYLNSSLFEESVLERTTIHIDALKGRLDLELYGATVLKDNAGKRLTGKKNTLHYLFEFLDAYDFSSEGEAEIQETPRTIINASVLGLIFEKINGYRDGSFYTPGFITMYICRETIRRAVVERFRASNLPGFQKLSGFDELRDRLDSSDREVRKRANAIINSLTVCDPAVGSGHFLVSALNELIAVKSELGILCYRDNGDRVKEYRITVENDELIVTDKDDDRLFAYILNKNNRPIDELQRLQETLFHEKETIIENCLFGVDINPKSVAICRLRLWIELLKSAYYTRESDYAELETLPNIDINIKCGNSLISRFAVSGDVNVALADKKKLKELTEKYRRYVTDYKLSTPTTATKGHLRKFIDDLKHDLERFGTPTDKDITDLRRKENFLDQLPLFAPSKKEAAERKKFQEEVDTLKKRLDIKQRTVYANAFEWRFEFPEVLDENGEFMGFDAVIGNPPYIPIEQFGNDIRVMFRSKYPQIERKYDSSVLFFIEGSNLLAKSGTMSFIAPLTWQTGDNYAKFRKYLIENKGLLRIINLPFDIFEDAYVDTGIYFISAGRQKEFETFVYGKKARVDTFEQITFTKVHVDNLDKATLKLPVGGFGAKLTERLNGTGFVKLGNITKSTQGLAGSRFARTEPEEPNAFPFLDKGNVYNYLLVAEKTCSVNMSDKPSLTFFYQAEPKVLIRRIINRQDRLSVAYTEEKLVFKKDINPFVPIDKQYSAKYLLAVLASKFVSHLYVNSSVIATKDDFRQTTLTELRALPIPAILPDTQAPIIALVDQILAKKANDTKADISSFEAEIDRLVYALYGLRGEEIAVVEGKR